MLSPHRFRQSRYDLFTYEGKWIGDCFADSARDAVEKTARQGTCVAYAKHPDAANFAPRVNR